MGHLTGSVGEAVGVEDVLLELGAWEELAELDRDAELVVDRVAKDVTAEADEYEEEEDKEVFDVGEEPVELADVVIVVVDTPEEVKVDDVDVEIAKDDAVVETPFTYTCKK